MLLDACIWCTFNQPVHSLWISAPQSYRNLVFLQTSCSWSTPTLVHDPLNSFPPSFSSMFAYTPMPPPVGVTRASDTRVAGYALSRRWRD
jgi:hypothetical protein